MIFCFQGAHRGCWIWKEALLQVCAASLVASYQNKQRWKQLPSQYPIVANKNDYHLDGQVLQGERVGLLLPGNCRTSGRQLPSPLHRPGVYFAENISPTIFHSSSTHSTPSSLDLRQTNQSDLHPAWVQLQQPALPLLRLRQQLPCQERFGRSQVIWSWKEQSYNNMTSRSPPFEEVLNPIHAWFHTIGSSLVLGLAFLHVVLVFVEERSCFRVPLQ